MEQRFIPLLLVVLLAFLVPILLSRFRRVPVVVGEILAGMIIGPSVLGLVHVDEPTLEFLAEIGFAFLMFLSGFEIDFSILLQRPGPRRDNGQGPLSLAAITFLLTLILALGAGFLFHNLGYIRDPWMMALILSTTSLGIVVPVLKERQLISGNFGQTILLASLLADFVTMFLITIYVAIRSTGLTLDILVVGLLFFPMVILYQLGVRNLKRPSIRKLIEDLSGATSQIRVRGAFALLMAFVVLAELLGVELILGAFLGGALASLLIGKQEEGLHAKLDAIGFGFFIPLFFIYVGVRFNLSAFLGDPRAWMFEPILLLTAFFVKMVPALLLRVRFSWREVLGTGFLLSSRLSLIIAASAIGLRLGVISEAINADIILTAALTATFAPLGFNMLVPHKERSLRVMAIYGGTNLALQVAHELVLRDEELYFVEPDGLRAATLRKKGLKVAHVEGDMRASFNAVSKDALITAFISLDAEDRVNLDVCRMARAQGIEHVVALSNDANQLPAYKAAGVQVFTPGLYRAPLLALMARNPSLFNLLINTEDQRDLREVVVPSGYAGKLLRELDWPGDVLVLAVQRGEDVVVPHGGTRLDPGDHLTVLGSLDSLNELDERLMA